MSSPADFPPSAAANGGSPPDRREFLSRSGSALGAAWILSALPLLQACSDAAQRATEDGTALRFFGEEEFRALDAMTARIIPTDDTPGAREANVARCIDEMFADALLPGLDAPVRGAIQMADGMAGGQGAAAFADLSEDAQDEIIKAMHDDQSSPYFPLFLVTMMGFLANPEYGGNRDEIGWRLLKFERAASFEPPFGYYDRLYREGGLV